MNNEPARHANAPSPLVYPFPIPPKPGRTIRIAPGVDWVRMPLPFALDHVNLWLLADGDGWTIVDTGLGSHDETKALWLEVFAATLGGRPVKRVIVTHFHPDHMGPAAPPALGIAFRFDPSEQCADAPRTSRQFASVPPVVDDAVLQSIQQIAQFPEPGLVKLRLAAYRFFARSAARSEASHA